ncbi:DUF7738 domain-containing protein [Flavobacterium oreochromis]|uniref:DUF7738 domain-containing protein n=2 Tax=Flavobacterium oreochromis TaxID=2906078 RepID=UPI00385B46C6
MKRKKKAVMVNKVVTLIVTIIIMSNLASCQNTKQKSNNCPEQGFCIQDTLLYYNAKRINVGEPIADFVKIAGKPDRIVTDSLGGNTNKTWKWSKGFSAYNDEKKIIFRLKEGEYLEYNSIEEVIKKYGKYDEYKEDKVDLTISKFYVWDNLGISVWIKSLDKIGQINIYPILSSKTYFYDMTKEDDNAVFKRHPLKEYKGNFTYNHRTVNLSKVGYTGWEKFTDGLKINGVDFDPPGDSKTMSRWIKKTDDLYVSINRYTNEEEYQEGLRVQDNGKIDGIKSIEIWSVKADGNE